VCRLRKKLTSDKRGTGRRKNGKKEQRKGKKIKGSGTPTSRVCLRATEGRTERRSSKDSAGEPLVMQSYSKVGQGHGIRSGDRLTGNPVT